MIQRLIRHFTSIPADQMYHFNVCMWIAFFVSKILQAFQVEKALAFLLGFVTAGIVGVLKECFDKYVQDEVFDKYDIRADLDGAFVGGLMSVI